jgi:secreted trypsin-like serine protease
VVAGTRDLSSVNTSDLINVVNRYVHGQYAIGATFNNDIALLKLEAPLDLPLASIAEATAYSSFVAAASVAR